MQKKWLGIITVAAFASGYSVIAMAAPPDMDDVPLRYLDALSRARPRTVFCLRM